MKRAKMKNLRLVDLFCGAGGLSKGFEKAGFETVAVVDNWNEALETFKINRKNSALTILGDVLDTEVRNEIIDIARSETVDLVIGGPPCQDFSSAGQRNGNGHNSNLTPLFAEIVAAIKPTWVVMENVNTIRSIGEAQLGKCKEILRKAGYGITIAILSAADFGVPQDRKRLFLMGRMNGKDDEMLIHMVQGKKPPVTVREFMPEIALGENATEYYYRHPRSYKRRAIFSIDEVSPVIRGVNRPIPKGYKFHELDAVKDLSRVRPLTTDERARIQSFPKEYRWVGRKTSVEQQIGNAVPPLLAEHIAKSIFRFERNTLDRFAERASPSISAMPE
jgi:DNA (cytosine-5)-methyltransferase 1